MYRFIRELSEKWDFTGIQWWYQCNVSLEL